jgi:hypothetical protein
VIDLERISYGPCVAAAFANVAARGKRFVAKLDPLIADEEEATFIVEARARKASIFERELHRCAPICSRRNIAGAPWHLHSPTGSLSRMTTKTMPDIDWKNVAPSARNGIRWYSLAFPGINWRYLSQIG